MQILFLRSRFLIPFYIIALMQASPAKSKLEPAELDRLAKLCGLFSSDHAGERASAAAMADRFLRDRGLRWPDVFGAPIAANDPRDAADLFATWPGGWRNACSFVLRHGCLSNWERAFAEKISGYVGNATPRQREILRALLDRCLDAGARP